MHFGLAGLVPLAMYVGAIVAFVLSVFGRPQAGLYYLIPLLPMQVYRYMLHDLFWGEKLVDVLLLGVVIGLLRSGERPAFLRTPLNKFLVGFGIFLYIMLWRGSFYLDADLPISPADPRFSDWKNFMVLPIIFIVVASAIRTRKQILIVLALMTLSVIAVNRGFYNTVSERDLSHFANELRYAGALGFAGENGFAAFEAQFCLLALAFYSFAKKLWIKAALLFVVLTCGYCILFSFSRGAYIAVLIGTAYLGMLKNRKLLVMLALLLTVWTSVVPVAVQERINGTYDANGKLEQSSADRVELWQDALQVAGHNMIVGTGYFTYKYMNRVGPFHDTHNLYLKVLVETGIIGVILFVTLLLKLFLAGWKLYRSAESLFYRALGLGFSALMLCTLVVNSFGDRWNYLQVTGFTWVLLGLVERAQVLTDEAQAAELQLEAAEPEPVGSSPVLVEA